MASTIDSCKDGYYSYFSGTNLPSIYGDMRWQPPSDSNQLGSAGSSISSGNSVGELSVSHPEETATSWADQLKLSLGPLIDGGRSLASPVSENGYTNNTCGLSDLALDPASIRKTPSPPQPVHQVTTSPLSLICTNSHETKGLYQMQNVSLMYCQTCSESFCAECVGFEHMNHVKEDLMEFVENARQEAEKAIQETRNTIDLLEMDLGKNQLALESTRNEAAVASNHVRETFREIKQLLEEREKKLLDQIETHRVNRVNFYNSRDVTLMRCIEKLKSNLYKVYEAGRSPNVLKNPEELIKWKNHACGETFNIFNMRLNRPVVEESPLIFEASLLDTRLAINQFGNLSFRAPGYNSVSSSASSSSASSSASSSLTSSTGVNRQSPRDSYQHNQRSTNSVHQRSSIRPIGPVPRGRAVPANGSTVKFAKATRSTNDENMTNVKHIGTSGLYMSETLCRPWGVASDVYGNLVVADRSNNRIVIFGQDGRVLRTFGSLGDKPGQFDRPAGIAVDSRRRIIVADKDNHRIQVFTMEGKLLTVFGEFGSAPGQFNYPWDVAVNSECQIAVSDSRNHRVQLFSPEGIFLRKYGFEGTPDYKKFESPRGITFNNEGKILANDFNNHCTLLIEPDMLSARVIINPHGSLKVIQRPQGLAVDDQGNIYVADSRNHRIAMFDKTGVLKWKFGTFELGGSRPDGMDRPSGIALTPEGRIAVVDFGNNRVKLI